jgi:type VI protein secretion system component VasK
VINQPPVQYKGEELDADRGPGLGCFRFQVAVLIFFIVLTPLTVVWSWPTWASAALLFAVIVLLLVVGQTIIFLLRLVAADRRSRRRPLASGSKTVGELEDERVADAVDPAVEGVNADALSSSTALPPEAPEPPPDEEPVRQ